jgi:hypothetical protein
MTILPCAACGGEGRKFRSQWGGNDPDIWDAGECEDCEGSGNQSCESRRCNEPSVGFNDNGTALCEDCMMQWIAEKFNDEEA